MKSIGKYIFMFSLFMILINPISAYAIGDSNINGGGGNMGQGTNQNVWTPGHEGVRVTVVRNKDLKPVTTPIDLTNTPPNPSTIYHFGKVSKIHYTMGKRLSAQQGGYKGFLSIQPLPKIVSSGGKNNIEAIKSYFTDKTVVQSIANLVGIKFNTLINGQYKLLLEPIAYYKYNGVMIATTATEAAMYDDKVKGDLKRKMASLTHQNLPLSMFLEVPDLGYPSWQGSTSKLVSNGDIITSLGLGIVKFKEELKPPIINSFDYVYRTNTEVITSAEISGGYSDPDNPVDVKFIIEGVEYNIGNVFYPQGGRQRAWVKWRTPSKPKEFDIYVRASGNGHTTNKTIRVRIEELKENTPPDPKANDRNDRFTKVSIPNRISKTRADWTVWRPRWEANFVWNAASGTWEDFGEWKFDEEVYTASISGSLNIMPDDKSATAKGKRMKSGYGIKQNADIRVSSNQRSAVTRAQTGISFFPEFDYNTYWRILEEDSLGKLSFKKNKYSTYNSKVHFTPVWYPDSDYEVNTYVMDAWTPVGMLQMNLRDSVTIKGSVYDDWHIRPSN